MNRQDQSVGTEGEAYQAGRDLIVNKGLSSEYMSEIMLSLARQLQSYFAEAEVKAASRMNELREEILKEFAKPDTTGKTQAFSEPDFQFVLRDAHQSYARSGDESLRQELVRLLIQRSNAPNGTRTALILNRAIAMAGSLTRQDFAVLCGLFVLRHCRIGASMPSEVFIRMSSTIRPFLEDLPSDNYAYDYLGSLSLVTVNGFTGPTLSATLHASYKNLFMREFTIHQLLEITEDNSVLSKIISLLVVSTNSDSLASFRFDSFEVADLEAALKEASIGEEIANRLTSLYEKYLIPEGEVEARMLESIPELTKISTLWNTTLLRNASLTALGKALAHSALTSQSGFEGLLSDWVR